MSSSSATGGSTGRGSLSAFDAPEELVGSRNGRRRQHPTYLSRHLDVLVRLDHQRRYASVGRADGVVRTEAGVERRSDLDAKETEPGHCGGADGGGVLSHAAREDERIETVHRGGHRRDERTQAVDVDIEGELRRIVAAGDALEDLAHVACAGERDQPALPVQRFGQLWLRRAGVAL